MREGRAGKLSKSTASCFCSELKERFERFKRRDLYDAQLAALSRALAADAKRYEGELAELVRSLDDTLLDEPGIGLISAAKLLAFDPSRFKHEAAFARCNGTAPQPASSSKAVRHRLNGGGDRQVNNAIQ